MAIMQYNPLRMRKCPKCGARHYRRSMTKIHTIERDEKYPYVEWKGWRYHDGESSVSFECLECGWWINDWGYGSDD